MLVSADCPEQPVPDSDVLEVAVGVIKDTDGKVLISLRHSNLHQGGLWEFPGGKIECGESIEQALVREIKEELNLDVLASTPLIGIEHEYPQRTVRLHVRSVDRFYGCVRHSQDQPTHWVAVEALAQYTFPAANRPIVTAARLPSRYAILDDANADQVLIRLEKMLNKGIRLIQARWKRLPPDQAVQLLSDAQAACRQANAMLLINSAMIFQDGFINCATESIQKYSKLGDGMHLTGQHLMMLTERPTSFRWLSASCHTLEEMRHAESIEADFIVLGSVLPTPSHPTVRPLGWQQFADWVRQVNTPVFALGGMSDSLLPTARQSGGQGIAGISSFII